MKDADLLARIGTDKAVADGLSDEHPAVTDEAVRKWRMRGIPWRYRAAVRRLARRRRVRVPADFVENRAA